AARGASGCDVRGDRGPQRADRRVPGQRRPAQGRGGEVAAAGRTDIAAPDQGDLAGDLATGGGSGSADAQRREAGRAARRGAAEAEAVDAGADREVAPDG